MLSCIERARYPAFASVITTRRSAWAWDSLKKPEAMELEPSFPQPTAVMLSAGTPSEDRESATAFARSCESALRNSSLREGLSAIYPSTATLYPPPMAACAISLSTLALCASSAYSALSPLKVRTAESSTIWVDSPLARAGMSRESARRSTMPVSGSTTPLPNS